RTVLRGRRRSNALPLPDHKAELLSDASSALEDLGVLLEKGSVRPAGMSAIEFFEQSISANSELS
ncbi:MAG: hypothetical protein COZ50_06565, partial [Zetaproteobacteria bacterium CG_4_10_14_3_um_filter_54_28]